MNYYEPEANHAAAIDQLKGPAISLMATAGIGAAFQLLSIGLNVLGAGMGATMRGSSGMGNMLSGGIGAFFNVIGLVMSVVVFLGASKMKNGNSYGFAMAATIIAMVPCVSPCCILGLPLGIWALIVLIKPEVKSAFQG
jgi:hypothetical protein